MLDSLARVPRLLVASDFDGTLAPIVDHPEAAQALPECVEALRHLAAADGTWVAIISGRTYPELQSRFGGDRFTLIGEHGNDDGRGGPPETPALARAGQIVEQTVVSTPGSLMEKKGTSVVFHYRMAPHPDAAVDSLIDWAATEPEVKVLLGKEVVELSVAPLDKGAALERLANTLGVDATLFLGDDATDETAFATLGPSDVGVKVGPGDTLATERVDDPAAVARLLTMLAEHREA